MRCLKVVAGAVAQETFYLRHGVGHAVFDPSTAAALAAAWMPQRILHSRCLYHLPCLRLTQRGPTAVGELQSRRGRAAGADWAGVERFAGRCWEKGLTTMARCRQQAVVAGSAASERASRTALALTLTLSSLGEAAMLEVGTGLSSPAVKQLGATPRMATQHVH